MQHAAEQPGKIFEEKLNVFSCRLILARHHLTQAEPSRWLGAAVFQEINPRVWWQTRALSCGRHRLGISTFGLLIPRAKPSWRVPLQKFQFLTEIERGMSHFRPTSRQGHLEEDLDVFKALPANVCHSKAALTDMSSSLWMHAWLTEEG